MYDKINVTSPLLPDLKEFESMLEDIWQRKWITNNGHYHQQLELALGEYLGVPYISLFTNGTLPLLAAFQILGLREGEVITTPYSFVATAHAILWNKLTPVFVDVDEQTGNIDSAKIEQAITDKTVAIMPVHVYGTPCDIEAIQQIADKHNIKVIYDAAHAFGVQKDGKSILLAGDLSTLSFHATKVYNTVEGGALICHDEITKKKIDSLKNFGFTDETTVFDAGLNGKMDEIRAAYGLLNLKQADSAIQRRQQIAEFYKSALKNIKGLRYLDDIDGVKHNYAYFPIFIDAIEYGISRDELFEKLKQQNINARKYFYPLITDFAPYQKFPSAERKNLPVAAKLADSVICLPMYADLTDDGVQRVIEVVRRK